MKAHEAFHYMALLICGRRTNREERRTIRGTHMGLQEVEVAKACQRLPVENTSPHSIKKKKKEKKQ